MAQYKYPPNKIIFPYGYVLFMPALGAYAWFNKGIALNEVGAIGIFFWMFLLAMAAPIVIWIANNISLRIDVTDYGIRYKSLLKDKEILWSNITDIQRRILYERKGWHDDPNHGNDLLIKLQDGTKIKIFGIIQCCDGKEDSIEELESLLRAKADLNQDNHECEKSEESRRQLRLAVVAGSLCTVMGVILLLNPMSARLEKLVVLPASISVSRDALILLIGGCGLTVWALYSLKKK